MNRKEHQKWNQRMAEKYDIDVFHDKTNFLVKYIENKRIKTVISLLDAQWNEMVLDVGCGSGRIMKNVHLADVVGIDISTSLLRKARDKYLNVRYGNAENIPFIDGLFDRVYCSEVIEHLLHPENAVNEIHRVTRKGGIAVISIPNEKLISDAKKFIRKIGFGFMLKNVAEAKNEWHLHEFYLEKLTKMTKGKFKIIKIAALPFSWFPLHYVVKFKVIK